MRNNEDYLDSLLNNVTKKLSEFDEDFEQKKQAADPYMTKKNLPPKTMKALESVRENQFLREFEDELDREDTDKFLEEFESELQDEEQEFEQTKAAQSADNDDAYMDQIEQLVSESQSEPQVEGDPLEEAVAAANEGSQTDDLGDLPAGDEQTDDLGGLPADDGQVDDLGGLMPEDGQGDDLGGLPAGDEQADDLSDLMSLDDANAEQPEDTSDYGELPEGMEALGDLFDNTDNQDIADLDLPGDAGEESLLPEDGDSGMSDDDIMKLLNGGGEDEALSDIGKMLEADDQSISLEDLGAEPENLSHAADVVERSQAEKKPVQKKKKSGFFAKLMDLLFGEDDDEVADEHVEEVGSLEGISDENMEILRAMNGDMAGGSDDGASGKKGRKKAKKEKKKKEPKPKKEKKEKKPKEPKPKKPRKEKKPKDVGPREKPLPKGPVIVIWVLALSVFAFVMIGNTLLTKSNTARAAQQSFDSGDYVGSYEAFAGAKVSAGEEELYEQAKTLAGVQAELNAYYPMMEVRKFDLALDCLVRTIGRADLHMADAEEWGVTTQMNAIVAEASQQLQDQFNVTVEQARELYAIDDRDDYSLALDEILKGLGLK